MEPKWSNRGLDRGSAFRRMALVAIIILLVGLPFSLWQIQQGKNLAQIVATVESKARFYSSETEIRYRRISQSLAQLASRGAPLSDSRVLAWNADAIFYREAFEGIESISWVDQGFLIREIVPVIGNESLLDQPASTLQQDPSQILLWQPIWEEERSFGGFVVGRISLSAFMHPVEAEIGADYAFQLSQDGQILVQSDHWNDAAIDDITSSNITLMASAELTMRFAPTNALRQSAFVAARWMLYAGLLIVSATLTAISVVQATKRMKVHKELQAQWANLEVILDGIPHIIYVADPDSYEILFVNQQLRRLLGVNPVGEKCYKAFQSLDSPCSFCTNDILRDTGEPYTWERFNPVLKRHFLITDRLIEWSNHTVARLELAMDVTERTEMEAQKLALEAHLRQSQKLESLGTLASGVAHEINNPLMGMIGYAELIGDAVDEPRTHGYSAEIIKEGNRIATIVHNLLAFSRQDKEAHSPAEIGDIIDASLSLMSVVLRKDQITLEVDIPKELPQVKCRSQQIQQVMINLLTNARDALNERYPEYNEDKMIRIAARSFEKDGVAWVRITMEDHGSGISENAAKRIFDPFFTTKPRDKGTGLGLSVSYGIVKEHHGELTVETVPGEYTRFLMDLRVNNGWSLKDHEAKE